MIPTILQRGLLPPTHVLSVVPSGPRQSLGHMKMPNKHVEINQETPIMYLREKRSPPTRSSAESALGRRYYVCLEGCLGPLRSQRPAPGQLSQVRPVQILALPPRRLTIELLHLVYDCLVSVAWFVILEMIYSWIVNGMGSRGWVQMKNQLSFTILRASLELYQLRPDSNGPDDGVVLVIIWLLPQRLVLCHLAHGRHG